MLYFATGNKHKVKEVSNLLAELGLEIEHANPKIEEIDSTNPKKIALDKAKQAFEKLRNPVITEDTGIWFKAYKDFPGTLPKRMFDCLGHEGLLKLLKGKDRNAYFLCTICFFDGSQHKFFEGKLEGKITSKVIKPTADRMPYEKIFIPNGFKKAVVEMTPAEKNAISHRAEATKKLGEWLKETALHELLDSI